jgi:hypothetical protein
MITWNGFFALVNKARMELPKVIIKDNYNEYLEGKKVKAALIDAASAPLQAGSHVIAFKDSIAAASEVPVPKQQQSHYIGVEGIVTEVDIVSAQRHSSERQLVSVQKLP